MTSDGYAQLFQSRIGACVSIVCGDRDIAVRRDKERKVLILARGPVARTAAVSYKDDIAFRPMELIRGGTLEIFVRVRERRGRESELVAYRIGLFGLPENQNRVATLRYDYPEGKPGGDGWEEDLQDNPQHPWAHLHFNFDSSPIANNLRLPTGKICPITVLCAFDFWYWSTFG
jgi:hypothetical protein